jgi:hypothetical protein
MYIHVVTTPFFNHYRKAETACCSRPNIFGETSCFTEETLEWQNSHKEQTRSRQAGSNKDWRDIHKNWVEYKGKLRKEVEANFRLQTGHDCPEAAHLRKICIYESSECTIYQIPNSNMDEEHLLCYPTLDTDQQVVRNTIKLQWDARAMMK